MTFTPEQTKMLAAKLDPANVKKNPKGFDYIEAWHAIDEMNRIFGHDGWDREMVRCVQCGEPYQVNGNWRVAYWATVRIRIHAGDRTVTRDGTGYGSGIGKDLNDAHESAVKEAESDAMKRALMTLGNPFGLALYDKTKANVGHEEPELIDGIWRYESSKRLHAEMMRAQTPDALKQWRKDNAAALKDLDAHDGPIMLDAYQQQLGRLTADLVQKAA